MKKQLCLIFSLLLLLFCACPVSASAAQSGEEAAPARTVAINNVADFLRFAEACSRDVYSKDVVFSLNTDLNLSHSDFSGVPYFAGTFLGNGHRILGLALGGDGSRVGLFRRVAAGAEIRQLHVQGLVMPGGTQCFIGGLAGVSEGSILSCSFSGTVKGLETVGGLVGLNAPGAVLDDCVFSGSVSGEHRVGGAAGQNDGVVSRCRSEGSINTEAIVPQSETHFDLAQLSEDTFLDLTDIGGIAGVNSGVLSACVNVGPVGYKNTGYNVGGIAGKSSGFITGCSNEAFICGRRDVGGITGQLIPSVSWDFSNDKLEALSGQIGSLSRLISAASQHGEEGSEELAVQLGLMQDYAKTAAEELKKALTDQEAIHERVMHTIHVDPETGRVSFDFQWVDLSSLMSALTDLRAQSALIDELIKTTVTDVREDLTKITQQMSGVLGGMYSLVGGAADAELYESYDISAAECYDHDQGAVADCMNTGRIEAEDNAGGLLGTVGYEVSFDMEDSLDASKFLTADASRYIFAVVRGSRSFGEVEVKADGAGGIVGSMDVGAAVNCVGVGAMRSSTGDYVGGVAGRSDGSIVGCWSRADLSGRRYVGGIAGLGSGLTGCRSWAHIEEASEYAGSVAGWSEGEITDNLYVDSLPAGIDGVSLSGQTDPVSAEELAAMEDLPEGFRDLTVQFLVDGTPVKTLTVPFGGSVTEFPEVANEGEKYWKWDEADLSQIYRSLTVSGKYYSPATTLSSGGELPQFLVEGVFYEGQELTVAEYNPGMETDDLIGAYTLYVDGYEGDLTVHLRTEEDGRIFAVRDDGSLSPVSVRRDGQYLVFELSNGASFVYRHAEELLDYSTWIIGGAAGLGAAAIVLVLVLRRRKKKKQDLPEEIHVSEE